MEGISGNVYCYDGSLYKIDEKSFVVDTNNSDLRIYEVVRIINGIPLFFEDHMERLELSANKKRQTLLLRYDDVKSMVEKVVEGNKIVFGNVMIVCTFLNNELHCLVYQRTHYYPTEENYSNGVNVGIIEIERPDPHVKQIDDSFNLSTQNAKSVSGIFEVLLVNNNGIITEASKANVFFIKGKEIFTAPEALVLKGVTRKHAIEAISNAGFQLSEKEILLEDLENIDGLFLTGTSINILPVSNVKDLKFDTQKNEIYRKVSYEFDIMIKEYIRKEENS